jgi:hypothetical protein
MVTSGGARATRADAAIAGYKLYIPYVKRVTPAMASSDSSPRRRAAPPKPRSRRADEAGARTRAAKPIPAAAQAAASRPAKEKLVRDSYTIPKAEYLVLEALKKRAIDLRRPAKKSELLRAGITSLQRMPDDGFLAALERVPTLKTGRPKGPHGKGSRARGRG